MGLDEFLDTVNSDADRYDGLIAIGDI